MAGPFDYTIQAPDIFKNVVQGYEYGVALTQRERERQQQEMLAQQQAQEQARIRQIQQEYMNNPRPDTGAALRFLSTLPPEQAKIAAGMIEKMPVEVQKQNLSYGVQMLAATRAGDFATVKSIAQERADAARNAGDENAARIFDFAAENAGKDPARDERALLAGLVQYPGGVEAVNSLMQQSKLPGELAKVEAEAMTARSGADLAATKAKFAESAAVMELEKAGWDIKKIQNDMQIARMNTQIAAMNAATSREGNAIKREENMLKLQELRDKRDTLVRDRAAEVSTAQSTMDNMLNTADRILKTPKNVIASAAGPISSRMPTLSSDTADLEALVETMGSQAFLSQLPAMKGTGALSEKEGDKLQAALTNLSLKQSPERLIENVKEAQRLVLKARKGIAQKYGVPDTVPDTPSAQPSGAEIDALLKKYGAR